MQMIQNAGLVFRDGVPPFVLAQMLTMAGEKDSRIGIQETSDLPVERVQHRCESVADGLICQTNLCATTPGVAPARVAVAAFTAASGRPQTRASNCLAKHPVLIVADLLAAPQLALDQQHLFVTWHPQ